MQNYIHAVLILLEKIASLVIGDTLLGPLLLQQLQTGFSLKSTHPVHTVIGACSVTECVECSQGLSHPPKKKTHFMKLLFEHTNTSAADTCKLLGEFF